MRADLDDASDAVLVVAIARFREDALEAVYRRHGGPCYRLAQRLLQNDTLAEDAVQEVFLLLWNEPERFDPERGSLRSWLLMKTHGRAVDALRSDVARRAREDREANDPVHRGPDIEREVWDLTVADRVQRAMSDLPAHEREAIRLAYFAGHTYREVAQLLGEPEGTVKSRIRTGMKTLRRRLGDLGSDATALEMGLER